MFQGLLVILGSHEQAADGQDKLAHCSVVLLASRAVNGTVAIALESGLIKQKPVIPTYGIIVDPNAPAAEIHNPAHAAVQGQRSTTVLANKPEQEQVPVASDVQIAMDEGATGSRTVPQTIDLDQELVRPSVLHQSELQSVPTQSLPQETEQSRHGDFTMKRALVEEEIERACLVADGACMACDEPVHLAIIPSDRSAFVHRNKNLMDRLVLVCPNSSRLAQLVYAGLVFHLHDV